MPTFPSSIKYGYVRGRYLLAVGDTTTDADLLPDAVAATGKVVLHPIATEIDAAGDDPAIIAMRDVVCTLDSSGRLVGPSSQPGVWLDTGAYEVQPAITGISMSKFRIVVAEDHTPSAPLDIALAAPLSPTPAQVFVVNQQVYLDTIAARDAAIAAAASGGAGPDIGDVNFGFAALFESVLSDGGLPVELVVTDNGNGLFFVSTGTSDNDDGTFSTVANSADNGDGTFTLS